MSDPAAAIEQGRRAKLAFEEFVKPTLDGVAAVYAERMKEIVAREPWEIEKLKALVMGLNVVDTVTQHMLAVIQGGEIARKDAIRIEELNSMPAARRRALGI